MQINTSNAVYFNCGCCGPYASGNEYVLTPYVKENGEIWLKAEGNGAGDDIMLKDLIGLTDEEIAEEYGEFDLDAMRADADEVEAAGDHDAAEWLRNWCEQCEAAVARDLGHDIS